MRPIGTKDEASKEAFRILEALAKMPEGSEKNDYLETVKRLNSEYNLGLEEQIPDPEEKSDEKEESDQTEKLYPSASVEIGGKEDKLEDKPENQYVKMLVAGFIKVLNLLNTPVFGEKKAKNRNR